MSLSTLERRKTRSGFALLLVLGILVLLSALVVGFMIRARTENSMSAGFKASVSAEFLGDMVTSLVQGQINMATTQGYNVAWASQPGMIRTFDSAGNTRNGFKLYSAPDMVVPGSSFAASVKNDCPSNAAAWTGNTALWTDLNAPVLGVDGKYRYPILDTGSASGEARALSAAPEGFSIAAAPVNSVYQPAPMPVRWLYVLSDGTIISPTSGTAGDSVNILGDQASSNPIVGRVAFWTDDETCKVNINTASEGNYWDTPKGNAFSERALGYWQPTLGEFQRYPGHPAMTCLSSVLSPSGTQSPNFAPASSYPARNNYMPQADYENAYKITPRVAFGGSQVGTTDVFSAVPVVNDVDRLFADPEELIFNPSRENTYGGLTLGRDGIEQSKFFLTTHSRAPEVNLFNLPRVACWPIYAISGASYDADHTTPFDQLIGLCSSFGDASGNGSGYPYFFQRQDPASPSELTAIPRNLQLYSYLDWLTRQAVPGYGKSFRDKYPLDQEQILTEIFDYIRSTNLCDDNVNTSFTIPFSGVGATPSGHGLVVPTQYSANGTMGFGRFFTLTEFGIGFICNADAANAASNDPAKNTVLNGVPLSPGTKKVQAIIVMNFYSPMLGWTSLGPKFSVEITGLQSATLDGHDLMFPADGSASYSKDPASQWGDRASGGYVGWRYTFFQKRAPTDAADPYTDVYPFISVPITVGPGADSASPATMEFGGVTATVKIFSGTSATGTPLQTFTIKLPSGTFPVPNLVDKGTSPSNGVSVSTTPQTWWAFSRTGFAGASGRLAYVNQSPGTAGKTVTQPDAGAFFRGDGNYDVVRTVNPGQGGNFGDFRLTAASSTVPEAVFQPQPPYSDKTVFMYSTLPESVTGFSGNCGWDKNGTYVAGKAGSYYLFCNPSIPSGVTGPTLTGDFDIGLPCSLDGPYINKPDEGNLGIKGTSSAIPYFLTVSEHPPGKTFFTPNRIMPSPGMFGSLPTGVKSGEPWKTLLFRPQANHPSYIDPNTSGGNIPDHLIMDLFWMPVVEPYAISDRFSTAGKINLNYQILPFTYITRSTGMRALLKSERIAAINASDIKPNYNSYSGYGPSSNATPVAGDPAFAGDFRHLIDAEATLAQCDSKFANFGAFRSADEICDLYMVPLNLGLKAPDMEHYWKNNWSATPDNMRERIYATLYPRLTTKSNTYTVHFRVQTLKKVKGADPDGVWTESKNVITSEYRGSTTIERFIDPNNGNIPDYAANPASIPSLSQQYQTLDNFYKWRVVGSQQFVP